MLLPAQHGRHVVIVIIVINSSNRNSNFLKYTDLSLHALNKKVSLHLSCGLLSGAGRS